ncbi:hypothetical protein ACFYST_00210 [Kitasatospora sp. NPDC004614]|uniref:hypothetical protein n=1 Tax=unclassified Kitasatospora TaxID=2633591 RepID=UPI0036944B03
MSTPPGATDRDRPVPLSGPRTPSGAPSQSGGPMVVCGGDALGGVAQCLGVDGEGDAFGDHDAGGGAAQVGQANDGQAGFGRALAELVEGPLGS